MDPRSTDHRKPAEKSRPGNRHLAAFAFVALALFVADSAHGIEAGPIDADEQIDRRADVSLVVDAGDDDQRSSYMLLDASPQDDWFGTPEFIGYDGARAGVDYDRLPVQFAGWEDRRVQVYDSDGSSCRGRIEGLYGLSRASATPRERRRWAGEPDRHTGEADEPLTPEEVAANLWDPSEIWYIGAEPVLAAKLSVGEGDCDPEQLQWAHRADRHSQPLEAVELAGDATRELSAQFRTTDGYRAVQQRFEQHYEDTDESWIDHQWTRFEINAFYNEDHDRTFAVVRADAGPGCGSFGGRTWSLFEISYDGNGVHIDTLAVSASHPQEVIMVDAGDEGEPVLVTGYRPWGGYRSVGLVEPGEDSYTETFTSRLIDGYPGCAC